MTLEEKAAADAAEAAKKVAAPAISEDRIVKALATIESIAKATDELEKVVTETKPFAKVSEEHSDEIAKAVEVSDFLKDVVSEVGDSLDTMSKDLAKGMASQLAIVKQQSEVIKGLTDELKSVRESVDKLIAQPVTGRKAVISKGEERFAEGEEGQLSVSAAKKGLDSLITKGKARPMDMLTFESTGKISKALYDEIKKEVAV